MMASTETACAIAVLMLPMVLAAFVSAPSSSSVVQQKKHSLLPVMGRNSSVYRPSTENLSGAILVLHGSGAMASDMFDLGFEAMADARNFLVVYPEMSVPKGNEWGYLDDIPYFSALARRLQQHDFGVPSDKIFICGHSAGGTMVTFLQNEMDEFAAAGVVEAAVGRLSNWTMARRGKPTMVVWNHADPVLQEYAPGGIEEAYFNLTVSTLRRGSSTVPDLRQQLKKARPVTQASLLTFKDTVVSPLLQVVSWRSDPGRHTWPSPSWTNSVDSTKILVDFFFGNSQ